MKIYKDALAKGWQLTTKYPWLWFFGFFALLINGNGSEYDFYFRKLNSLTNEENIFSPAFWRGQEWEALFSKIQTLWSASEFNFIILCLIFIISLGVLIYFIIVSQVSLVQAANNANKKDLIFKHVFWNSHQNWKSVLLINIIAKVATWVALLLIIVPFLKLFIDDKGNIYNYIYFTVAVFILLPVLLLISFVSKYAINYAVIKNQNVKLAIKNAFILFKANWLTSLEMALIIFVISMLLGIFVLLGVVILLTPFIISVLTLFVGIDILITMAILLLIIAFILMATIFSAWQWTSWTYLFQELTKKRREGKLLRVIVANKIK